MIVFLILALAAYRITRLFIDDGIFDRPRELLHRQFDPNGKVMYLLNCYWCMSIYVCAALTVLTWAYPAVMVWVLMGFAASAVVGIIAEKS